MKRVMIVNNNIKPCGIQQWGSRIINSLQYSKKYAFSYYEIGTVSELFQVVVQEHPNVIIYNFNPDTMNFITYEVLQQLSHIKHVAMVHEGYYHKTNYVGFEYMLYLLNYVEIEPEYEKKVFFTPMRYLLPYSGDYPKNDVVTIGSFGFGFSRKRFDYLVEVVNEEFDVAKIRLSVSKYPLGDKDDIVASEIISQCYAKNIKPGITLEISRDFLPDNLLLQFLAGNDINCFFYDSEKFDGIAGSTDIALSVKRPVAITNVPMFNHLHSIVPEICIENNSLKTILSMGTEPLEPLYNKFSRANFILEFERILDLL